MLTMKVSNFWAAGLSLCIALIAYQFFYVLQYFPITEGWFSAYAWLIREGNIPYRDFSLLMPPLYPLEIAFIQSIFGDQLWVLRFFGIVIVCGIGLSLWGILARFFNNWIAAFSAVIATIYYQSGNAFIGYDFTQVLTLNLLLFVLFALKELDSLNGHNSKATLFTPAFFAGLFLTSAILTKQSNAGLFGLVVFIGLSFIIYTLASARTLFNSLVRFCLGAAVLLIPLLIWLVINHSLSAFLHQIIIDAMQSKGGGSKIFLGWVNGFFMDGSYFPRLILVGRESVSLFTWTCIPLVGIFTLQTYLSKYHPSKLNQAICSNFKINFSSLDRTCLVALGVLFLAITAYCASPIRSPSSQNAHEYTLSFIYYLIVLVIWMIGCTAVYFGINFFIAKRNQDRVNIIDWLCESQKAVGMTGFFLLFGMFLYIAIRPELSMPLWRGYGDHIGGGIIFFSTNLYIAGAMILATTFLYKPSLFKAKLWILFLAGIGLIMGNGTSAGLSEISAFYGLAIVLATLLTLSSPYLIPAVVPLVLSMLFTFSVLERKLEAPYSWWSVKSQDIRQIVCAKTKGLLSNICVEPHKYEAIESLVSSIKTASSYGDELYVFPHMPIFNLMSGRLPYKNLVVSWFDFTSQERAKNIAIDLLKDPPQMMLIARIPIEVFEGHERLFNHSMPSEQRNIVASIDELVKSRKIKLIESEYVDGLQLDLYQKVR